MERQRSGPVGGGTAGGDVRFGGRRVAGVGGRGDRQCVKGKGAEDGQV